jgi:hypothetical protein
MTTVRVQGLRELEAALKAYPARLQRRALNAAMRAGAREVLQEVKARAPVRTGALRRNVVAKRGRAAFDKGLAGRQIVGVRHGKVRTRETRFTTKSGKVRSRRLSAYDRRGQDPFYFRFQELGFHAVGRRKAATRAERSARKTGNATYGRFIPGKRFLRDGLAVAAPRALDAIRGRLAREIERLP